MSERYRIQTPSGFIVPGYGATDVEGSHDMAWLYADMMGWPWSNLTARGYRIIRMASPAPTPRPAHEEG